MLTTVLTKEDLRLMRRDELLRTAKSLKLQTGNGEPLSRTKSADLIRGIINVQQRPSTGGVDWTELYEEPCPDRMS
jgi:hypothetical protein